MTAKDVVEHLRNDEAISSKDQEKAVAIIEANSAFVEEILNDGEHSSEEKSNAIQNLLNEDWEEPIDQSPAPSNADRKNG